jgi:CRISPR/Cas system-associated protein Csx1
LEADPFLVFTVIRERGDSAFIFDKRINQVFIMQKEKKLKGFYNDIDGGMPYWPIYINRKQEVVSFLYPDEMKEMLTNEYFRSKKIRDEESNKQLRELIGRLKDEDNPVLVIARLK